MFIVFVISYLEQKQRPQQTLSPPKKNVEATLPLYVLLSRKEDLQNIITKSN
jgi:hypothetical protein